MIDEQLDKELTEYNVSRFETERVTVADNETVPLLKILNAVEELMKMGVKEDSIELYIEVSTGDEWCPYVDEVKLYGQRNATPEELKARLDYTKRMKDRDIKLKEENAVWIKQRELQQLRELKAKYPNE